MAERSLSISRVTPTSLVGVVLVVLSSCSEPQTPKGTSLPVTKHSEASKSQPVGVPPAKVSKQPPNKVDGLIILKAEWSPGYPKTPDQTRIPKWDVVVKNQTDKPICNVRYATEYFDDSNSVLNRGGYFSGPNRGWLRDFKISAGETKKLLVPFELPRASAIRASFEIVFWENWDPNRKLFCESY